jgi:transposase-like protein
VARHYAILCDFAAARISQRPSDGAGAELAIRQKSEHVSPANAYFHWCSRLLKKGRCGHRANISEVARRHGVVRGLLTVWRHKFATAAGLQAPGFVPVRITSESGPATADEPDRLASAHEVPPLQMSPPPGKPGGVIEIEVRGARIRVEPGVELATLSTVLSALRGIR